MRVERGQRGRQRAEEALVVILQRRLRALQERQQLTFEEGHAGRTVLRKCQLRPGLRGNALDGRLAERNVVVRRQL